MDNYSVGECILWGILLIAMFVYLINLKKIERKKQYKEFLCKSLAIAVNIAACTREPESELRFSVENSYDSCAGGYADKESNIYDAYARRDYMLFAYLCAEKYANSLKPEYGADLKQYCENMIPYIRYRYKIEDVTK